MTLTEGKWDGELKRDQPEYKVTGWLVNAKDKTLQIFVNFISPQGSQILNDSRTYMVDLTKVPVKVKNRFLDQYNFITDKLIKVTPELKDGIEK